jgi:hypothetical protein
LTLVKFVTLLFSAYFPGIPGGFPQPDLFDLGTAFVKIPQPFLFCFDHLGVPGLIHERPGIKQSGGPVSVKFYNILTDFSFRNSAPW